MQVLRQTQANTDCALDIWYDETRIGVSAGNFKINGASYWLSEDSIFTLEAAPHPRTIFGFLIASGGAVRLRVHEVAHGLPMKKDEGAAYLYNVFRAFVPANADLSKAKVEVACTIPETPQ